MTKSLDLGCGSKPKNPFNASEVFGVDIRSGQNIKKADLAIEPIPWPDNYFDYVTAHDFIEHIPRILYCPQHRYPFIELMNEIYRVLKPGGIFYSFTPAFPSPVAFVDPTHVNFITEGTFGFYFCVENDCYAKIYGFNGKFSFMDQKWQGPHLITNLKSLKDQNMTNIMLDTPTFSCVAIDTAHHNLSKIALQTCAKAFPFDKIIFITDIDPQEPNWEWHRIKRFENVREYNYFCLKNLYFHIETDYVLVMQYDGYISNPEQWDATYLEYDYIGGPIMTNVGNGGFSIRSKKLLQACLDENIYLTQEGNWAEDYEICARSKKMLETKYGLCWAPLELAKKFAVDLQPVPHPTWGFHGIHHLVPYYQGAERVQFLLDNFQPYLFKNIGPALRLAISYVLAKNLLEAGYVIKKLSEYAPIESVRQLFIETVPNGHRDFDRFWNLQNQL